MRRYINYFAFAISITIFISPVSIAESDDLGDFEKSSTRKSSNTESSTKHHDHESSECLTDQPCDFLNDFLSSFISGMFYPFIKMAENSAAKMAENSEERETCLDDDETDDCIKRKAGDPDIPNFALDLNYLTAKNNIHGIESRVEAGYGPIGLQLKNINYRQDEFSSSLNISHAHLLYRGLYKKFQLNLGIGGVFINGQQSSEGSSFLIQANAFPNDLVSFSSSYISSSINNNNIIEYDNSIAIRRNKTSLRAGYKLNRAHEEEIRGPYIGISLRY